MPLEGIADSCSSTVPTISNWRGKEIGYEKIDGPAGALCLAWLLPGVFARPEVYTLNGQVVDIITPAYPEETHMTIMLWVNNPPASLLRETNIPQPTNVLGISEVPREPWLGLNTIVKIKVEPGEPFSGNQRSIRFISWLGTSPQGPSPQASGGASFQAVISEGGAPLTEAPMPSNGFCNRYTPHEGLAPLRISTPPGAGLPGQASGHDHRPDGDGHFHLRRLQCAGTGAPGKVSSCATPAARPGTATTASSAQRPSMARPTTSLIFAWRPTA